MTQDGSRLMGKKEWTDEDVQTAISEAVRIVSEDRDKATYAALHERFGGSGEPPKESGGAPPAKEPADPAEPKKGKSLWWGDVEDA